MTGILSEAALTALLVAVLASALPLLLAAVGETVSEQAGVLGLGLEGVLLVGGYTSFAVVHVTGGLWLGFLCGAVAGALLSLVLVVLSVRLGVNQIVVGIGIALLGTGISSMLYEASFADTKPRLGAPEAWVLHPLSEIPVIGPALFAQPGMFTVSFVIAALVSLWLYRTVPGLRLRAAGQRPASLDAIGGSVGRSRSVAVLFAGAMGGLGGAYLALVSAGTFTPGMTHGLGFLAIVVAMLGRGRVLRVVLISLVYGVFVAGGTALQLADFALPNDLVAILPFIAVLIVLTFFGRRAALPPALAVPYVRGAR
ncbi:MAG: ABC transporter permease [Leucobacter sp.]|nr:ABC transporter permease [Leucobacter sp.]